MALPFLDKKGEADGYIISFKDITLIREIQEENYQRNRMASLGVMASGIAHEIRNPLAGIKAIAQTFEDEFVVISAFPEETARAEIENNLPESKTTLFVGEDKITKIFKIK